MRQLSGDNSQEKKVRGGATEETRDKELGGSALPRGVLLGNRPKRFSPKETLLTKRTGSMRFRSDVYDRLEQLAKANKTTVAELIRDMVDFALESMGDQ